MSIAKTADQRAHHARHQREYMARKLAELAEAGRHFLAEYLENERTRNRLRRRQLVQAARQDASIAKRIKARTAVMHATARGKLLRPDRCSECNRRCKPVGHHDDYDKPLVVRWVCQRCHFRIHAEMYQPGPQDRRTA
jgi:hypothetical protein